MNATFKKHLDAIERGEVTKSNVIGMRKAINAAERQGAGYSVSSTAPRVSVGETLALRRRLAEREPRVIGELHDSGKKVLRNPRYRNRFNSLELTIIERLEHFRLVGFDLIGPRYSQAVPVYRAVSATGQSFCFRNIPWQSAWTLGEESGPVIVPELD